MKKAGVFTLVLGLAIWVGFATTQNVYAGSSDHDTRTKHYGDTLFKVTDNGEYSVEVLLPDQKVEMGVNKIDIIIHDKKDGDVAGADITVTPWMPSMDHGVMEKPVVNEKGGGLYTATNVVFSMTGDWELRLRITKGSITETVAIALPPIGAMGHTPTMKAPDLSRIDTAVEKMSGSGHFKVSYSSEIEPVPVNKIHSWNLQVMTANGKPVRRARMLVLGDMPEHGHGFPTEPEVTAGRKNGLYLVEGLKFSMPGWWVVTFHIAAGEMMDHVSFNLLLQ
jgi:hypothetical protein